MSTGDEEEAEIRAIQGQRLGGSLVFGSAEQADDIQVETPSLGRIQSWSASQRPIAPIQMKTSIGNLRWIDFTFMNSLNQAGTKAYIHAWPESSR
jgi:hypothetical protein